MSHRLFPPTRSSCFAVALLAATNALVPTAAFAQSASTQAASPQVRYRQAHEAFSAGKWDDARRLLLDLWKERPSYDVAVTLVQVEYQLKHKAVAARYLQYALANAAPTEKPEVLEAYKKQLEELKRSVASVTVTVEPSAEVSVDEQLAGTAPLEGDLFLESGPHTISARLSGRVASQTIRAGAGSHYAVDLALQTVSSGLAPTPTTLPKTSEASRTADGGSMERLAVLAIGGGLTLVSAGIGIAYAVKSGSKQSDVDRLKGNAQSELGGNCEPGSQIAVCRDLTDATDARNSANTTKTVAFVASGVLLAGTALTYFLWPQSEGGSATRVVPIAGPQIAGLTIKGEF
jgi:hypothetical protein